MALNAAFGDGYEIYQNDVEQGLKEPCFLIAVLQPEITPMLGRRFIKRNPFDIQYFPTNPRNNAEMFTVAETMMEALDFITLPSGDLLHGTSVNYEIVDNVLHFFVNYNLPMIRPAEETYMETLETEVGTIGGDYKCLRPKPESPRQRKRPRLFPMSRFSPKEISCPSSDTPSGVIFCPFCWKMERNTRWSRWTACFKTFSRKAR